MVRTSLQGTAAMSHPTSHFKLGKKQQKNEHRADLKVLLFYLYWMKVKALICCQRWNEKRMSGRYRWSRWSGERPFVFGPRLPPWVLVDGKLLCGLNASSFSRLLFSYLCQQIWNKGSVAMATQFSKRINHSFPLWNLREHLTLFLA